MRFRSCHRANAAPGEQCRAQASAKDERADLDCSTRKPPGKKKMQDNGAITKAAQQKMRLVGPVMRMKPIK
ncbi:hypothetical protein NDU88_007927 [Pleurodeles waltl]|uniref:Uncharacterized protein n=1 Tax=Pleurodeles waltl TaxID=8319 RepID=A0AAV7VV13_PLEWA|nr:hypothetical protein NDU88_007927 [Pleurodeles waltl]